MPDNKPTSLGSVALKWHYFSKKVVFDGKMQKPDFL